MAWLLIAIGVGALIVPALAIIEQVQYGRRIAQRQRYYDRLIELSKARRSR